jgi:hypothetical protein
MSKSLSFTNSYVFYLSIILMILVAIRTAQDAKGMMLRQ